LPIGIVPRADLLIDSLALLFVSCGALLLCDSAAHFLADCGALLGGNCGADDITHREALLLLSYIHLGCADLVSNLLALKIIDSGALLLPHRGAAGLLDSCTHALTTRAALLLCHCDRGGLALSYLYSATHLLGPLCALLLLYIYALLLCGRGALLLCHRDAHILVLCAALLLTLCAALLLIHCPAPCGPISWCW
jgi:hypothetical protein